MKQIGLRSYQVIITPEEKEERDRKRYEREIYEQEKAEYLAEERREKEMLENRKEFLEEARSAKNDR